MCVYICACGRVCVCLYVYIPNTHHGSSFDWQSSVCPHSNVDAGADADADADADVDVDVEADVCFSRARAHTHTHTPRGTGDQIRGGCGGEIPNTRRMAPADSIRLESVGLV